MSIIENKNATADGNQQSVSNSRVRRPEDHSRANAREKARNDMTRNRRNHKKDWTDQEIRALWLPDCTLDQIAHSLDRSIGAVRGARYIYQDWRPEGVEYNGVAMAYSTESQETTEVK